MRLTSEQVEKVAELARLQLSPTEKERYTEQLSAVLDYFHMLSELETVNVSPTSHALMLQNVLREDTVSLSLEVAQVLQSAPQAHGHLFSLRRTFER